MRVTDEASATEIAETLSADMLQLLRAEAKTIGPLFHSPKYFLKESYMSLESMIRGSSELGAVLAAAWGIRQIDKVANTIHVENLKPRDFEPCGPFQIIGRPYIDQTGDFALLKKPEDCGCLADEQPELNPANSAKHDERTRRIAIVAAWLKEDPNLTSSEMVVRFKAIGVDVDESSVRRYRTEARKGKIL